MLSMSISCMPREVYNGFIVGTAGKISDIHKASTTDNQKLCQCRYYPKMACLRYQVFPVGLASQFPSNR